MFLQSLYAYPMCRSKSKAEAFMDQMIEINRGTAQFLAVIAVRPHYGLTTTVWLSRGAVAGQARSFPSSVCAWM